MTGIIAVKKTINKNNVSYHRGFLRFFPYTKLIRKKYGFDTHRTISLHVSHVVNWLILDQEGQKCNRLIVAGKKLSTLLHSNFAATWFGGGICIGAASAAYKGVVFSRHCRSFRCSFMLIP